ncbi:MAG: site-specific DNA-methyltransferase [Planctomycetaceae bacterium]|jgi:adenine-specific DNA-methyltransferase|nr:site-specific DNA-methyltransferase [Planctomycetaceae bacterium]
MPILSWLSREDDLKRANQTQYRLLEELPKLSYGDKNIGNMLIQGDNLEALKALLPFYAGQVKCIYIDPPYNTGSAFEHYDDNLEHTKWLSMIYPRLELLRELLTEDGSIWISIDDDEGHYLKVICDEIFGRKNFVNTVIWQKKHTRANDAKWFSDNHDLILCFTKNKEVWRPNLLQRNESSLTNYTNPDNDPRGIWASGPCHAKTPAEKDIYEITTPSGRKIMPPAGTSWRFNKEKFQELIDDNRIYFGTNGNNVPRYKRFITEVQDGFVPLTIWTRDEVADNQEGKTEIKKLFPNLPFSTPKPERLIERILTLGSNPNDLVLDSFLGSGTTAAVALKMGRQFIGIEMGEHAQTHCVVRLKKVIDGERGGISESIGWQGSGGFRFFQLGEPVFDSEGRINEKIKFCQLAAHIWFYETKTPFNKPRKKSSFLGMHNGTAYALLYNGILHDRRINGGNVLTTPMLDIIINDAGNAEYDSFVIYGECSRIGEKRLKSNKIVFKQIPYDLKIK